MCRSRESAWGTVSFISDGIKFYYRDVLLIRQTLENAAGRHSDATIIVTIRRHDGKKPKTLPLKEFMELIGFSYMRYIGRNEIEKLRREAGQESKGVKKRKRIK